MNFPMDPEKQPLLRDSDNRQRRFRPLTTEEVLTARHEIVWRRTRFFLVLMFWAIIAMCLSIISGILANHQCSSTMDSLPNVPPVHMSFVPLITKLHDDNVYTM